MILLRRGYRNVFITALIVVGVVLGFAKLAQAQNGSLYFSPSTGDVSVGQNFSIVLRVNTGGAAINAAEGSIIFDSQKLSVVSISRLNSIFNIWATEPTFSNPEGTIDFTGGLPSPGYSGSNGIILTINFKAKTATITGVSTEITLVSGGVLANDGYGTNILSSFGKAVYVISPRTITPEAPKEEVPIIGAKTEINSSTHPDQDKWYSNGNPSFEWKLPSGTVETRLTLSRNAVSVPAIRYIPPIFEKKLEDVGDGVWYLHAQFRTAQGLGPVSTFKFQIDTQNPNAFEVTRVDADPYNKQPQLIFESYDDLSGIDHYEIKIGDAEWFAVEKSLAGKPYTLPKQKAGNYKVEVRAVDQAGNYSSAFTDLIIQGREFDVLISFVRILEKSFDMVVNGLSVGGLLIAFILALIGMLVSLAKLFEKNIKKWWNSANRTRRLKAEENKSIKNIEHIVKDMKDELKFLKSISLRRHLGPEEKYLKAKIEQYLRALKGLGINK